MPCDSVEHAADLPEVPTRKVGTSLPATGVISPWLDAHSTIGPVTGELAIAYHDGKLGPQYVRPDKQTSA